jgi:sugar (pentulose or hexulose) kinase
MMKKFLGIEFGSTRVKAVLINENHEPVASGGHDWENRCENGYWTYTMDDVRTGIQQSYKQLSENYFKIHNESLTEIDCIGVSAMMHGYLPFDKDMNQLAPFRTWRNTYASPASRELTKLFNYPIPARWSIAHLYHAVKNNEPHVKDIVFQTTLAGYVHQKLTGEKVLGLGEASGMFPIDTQTKQFDKKMIGLFNSAIMTHSAKAKSNIGWKLENILPKVKEAGCEAGNLTQEGAKLLDPDGDLKSGIPFCPPEGDAGTGMVATNSCTAGTGNISAGTSIFGMIVLEKDRLKSVHPEIDLLATPAGKLVAMAHCNNCSSEINAWISVFGEAMKLFDVNVTKDELYSRLFMCALDGKADTGGLTVYNYLSGEHITHVDAGRPMFLRTTESEFNLPNFMRAQLYSAFATLKIGFDILFEKENVTADNIFAHGGLFKTEGTAQQFLADALNVPISLTKTANEGGAWGMAVLASYTAYAVSVRAKRSLLLSLEDYLAEGVFASAEQKTLAPNATGVRGFKEFMKNYIAALPVLREAVKCLKN